MTDLNTTRHTITEHPMTTFWRDVNTDLARRGLEPARGGEVSWHWLTTTDAAVAAAAIARARKPALVVVEGGQ
jgi:hypothetical protein